MKKFRIGLLPRIIIAIVLGIGTGFVMPEVVVRLFVTFNGLFSQFLGFIIPLIIVGLVTPAIADIGKGAGKMLVATTLLAYVATVLSGFLSFGVGDVVFPHLITNNISIEQISEAHGIEPFFTVAIPEPLNIMTALVMAFTMGLGLAHLKSTALRDAFVDLKDIIVKTIQAVILPLLPLYIFGIFMNMTHSGQVVHVLSAFMKVIVVIFHTSHFPSHLSIQRRRTCGEEESFPPAAQYAAGILHGARHIVVGSDHPCDAAPDYCQRRG